MSHETRQPGMPCVKNLVGAMSVSSPTGRNAIGNMSHFAVRDNSLVVENTYIIYTKKKLDFYINLCTDECVYRTICKPFITLLRQYLTAKIA